MTIDDIAAMTKPTLTPSDVAPLLGCNPYAINVQAKADIRKLGFPAALVGTRVKIPREAFVRWWKGKEGS